MNGLRFEAGDDTADADERVLSDEELEQVVEEGKAAEASCVTPRIGPG
jgi:hypothetical protein